MNGKYLLILIFMILLSLNGCQKRLPDRYVARNVSTEELVGVWKITEETLKVIRSEYGDNSSYFQKSQQVKLFEDGSCTIEMCPSIPSLDYIDESYKSTWKLTQGRAYIGHEEIYVQLIEIENTKENYGNNTSHSCSDTIKLYIAEEKGKLILWDFMGDPDYCIFRDLRREE